MTTKNTPARTRTRNAKPGKPDTTVTPLMALIAWARTITPANIIAELARVNDGYTTATRNVGRHTGARIVAFQNMTMIHNAEWQLDDCQLAALWSAEFPAGVGRVFAMNALPGVRPLPSASSITDAIGIVRGVRSHYNANGHGEPTGKPATPSVPYGAKRFAVTGGTVAPAPVADVAPVADAPAKRRGRNAKTA